MSRALNLARRPFRNERLPTLLLGLGCLALGVVTVRHAFAARDLLPGRAQDVERAAVTLEGEVASLREETQRLGGQPVPTPVAEEWAAVKVLVDRRAFSWTGLLSDLEQAVPAGVRLVSIAPRVEKGRLVLSLALNGREVDDALALYAALSGHSRFRNVELISYAETDRGLEIECRAAYEPTAGAAAPAPAKPVAGPAGAVP